VPPGRPHSEADPDSARLAGRVRLGATHKALHIDPPNRSLRRRSKRLPAHDPDL